METGHTPYTVFEEPVAGDRCDWSNYRHPSDGENTGVLADATNSLIHKHNSTTTPHCHFAPQYSQLRG